MGRGRREWARAYPARALEARSPRCHWATIKARGRVGGGVGPRSQKAQGTCHPMVRASTLAPLMRSHGGIRTHPHNTGKPQLKVLNLTSAKPVLPCKVIFTFRVL